MNEQEARTVLERYDSAKYWRYADLTQFVHAWALLYPGLCRTESIGRSPEGREIWSLTLTNFATGADTDKPAYHLNGQHHAGEVTASSVALYTIHYLLTNYGRDAAVTELLDTRTVYVLPRISVDGTEWYFDNPQMVRSSPLLYPNPDEPEGLRPMDLDGDGRILRMRLVDPAGDWRASDKDHRLMVRRLPEDREGTFYKIYTEGLIKERTPEGVAVHYAGRGVTGDPGGAYARERGFDFNRNYPTNWQPQHRQPGSGRYPFDRPEVRAMAEFWLAHPNIGGAISYHTYAGMNLRPSPLIPDDKMDEFDLRMYKTIGEVCTRLTGYPTVSVYDYFTVDYKPEKLDVGSWLEWAYDEKGVLGYETELWDFPYIAGVKKRPFKELAKLSDAEREADQLLLLQWNDRELAGKGFRNWTPFDHPQLGRVEIGGWEPKFLTQNPPEQLLHQECHKNCLFALEHALALPKVAVGEVRVRPVGARLYRVAVQVVNRGFLPTNVTQVAVKLKEAAPVEVSLSGSATVVGGKPKQNLGHIAGRGAGEPPVWGNPPSPATDAWAEWVVQAEPGTVVTVEVQGGRGGKAAQQVRLGD